MIFMPPQHGKSELVSRRFPAFLLGRNPNLRLIGCSNNSDLAVAMNRDVQRIMTGEAYAGVFPKTIVFCDEKKPNMVGIEAEQFQELLVHEFRREGNGNFSRKWPLYQMSTGGVPKVARIRRLSQYVINRELRFKADSPGCRLLVDQLMDFPLANTTTAPTPSKCAAGSPALPTDRAVPTPCPRYAFTYSPRSAVGLPASPPGPGPLKKSKAFTTHGTGVGPGYWVLSPGYWLLATGYWLLSTVYWVLGTGVLCTGYWVLSTEY